MGCCCTRTQTYETFPEDTVQLEELYTGDSGWDYKIFATDVADLRVADDKATVAGDAPTTLTEVFTKAVQNWPNAPALRHEPAYATKKDLDSPEDGISGPRNGGTWKTWTYSQMFDESKALGKAILSLGLKKCDGVAIWGFNSPYWTLASLGGMLSGGVSMGIYPTDTPEIVAYKIKHCNCVVAFVESAKHQAVVEGLYSSGDLMIGVEEKYNQIQCIVVWNTPGDAKSDLPVYSWDQFVALADKVDDATLEAAMDQEPGKVINYCYTSGTTGLPKAVMLTNDNLTWNCKATFLTSCEGVEWPAEMRSLSYLPMSHIAACMLDIFTPIVFTSGILETAPNSYWCVHFARGYDLKKGTLKERLLCAQPTMFLAVPRVWEKIEFSMRQMAQTGCIGDIISSLKNKNLRNAINRGLGRDGSEECCSCIANKLGGTIQAKLGLDECLFCITGAAPIRAETLSYFASIGLDIYELYGMSEMCATGTCNIPGGFEWGTIGGKMKGMEVAIFNENNEIIQNLYTSGENVPENCQGEIRVRGRNIMMGYLANPALGQEHVDTIIKKNQDALTKDGWIMSGDKAAKNKLGMFKITGRFKELIITAGGENVAPIPLENYVKINCNAVSNIMMYGDKMPYNVAVITLRCDKYTGFERGSENLDRIVFKSVGAEQDCDTVTELIQKDEDHPVIKAIIDTLKAANKDNKCCPSNASKIQKFMILPADFAVESGELTATLKLKRSVVAKQYADAIASIYEAPRSALYVKYQM